MFGARTLYVPRIFKSPLSMRVYNKLLGNISSPEWHERLKGFLLEQISLDPWTSQKSRFVARSDRNREYAIALERHMRIADGDIIEYLPEEQHAVILRVQMNDVMVIDMSPLMSFPREKSLETALELGHALGNQHWPAVVKGVEVFIPLTTDKKVMNSVMRTHNIDGISYEFRTATQVIPYLSPNEIRQLFGGANSPAHTHQHQNTPNTL